jgi:hypothetical protein
MGGGLCAIRDPNDRRNSRRAASLPVETGWPTRRRPAALDRPVPFLGRLPVLASREQLPDPRDPSVGSS